MTEAEAAIAAYFKRRPRIAVDVVDETSRRKLNTKKVRRAFESELGRERKVTVIASERDRVALRRRLRQTHDPRRRDDQRCELGKALSENAVLRVEVYDDSVSLSLQRLESQCASTLVVDISRGARPPSWAQDAVYELMHRVLRKPARMPNGSVSVRPTEPTPSARRDAPGRGPAVEASKAAADRKSPSDMVEVPAGEFTMGSDSGPSGEKPSRRVYLDAYFIDRTEVTVEGYGECLTAGMCTTPEMGGSNNWGKLDRGTHPVNGVTWMQANAYCRWKGKPLPTEAEWEKAARGTDGRQYPWGNQKATCTYAVMDDGSGNGCGKDRTWPVGSKPRGASPYGALDMAGNVREWVSDWYDEGYYAQAPACNPQGPTSGPTRVDRGGSFHFYASYLRASYRDHDSPGNAYYYLGFRCAKSAR